MPAICICNEGDDNVYNITLKKKIIKVKTPYNLYYSTQSLYHHCSSQCLNTIGQQASTDNKQLEMKHFSTITPQFLYIFKSTSISILWGKSLEDLTM